MKIRILQPVLPFLALPLLSVAALGQTTGVAHPDEFDDTTAQAPRQTLHYAKPSHDADSSTAVIQAAPASSAPATVQSYPATAPVSETSYPATGSAPAVAAEPTPALIIRQPDPSSVVITAAPATYTPVQSASLPVAHQAAIEDDSGIVMSVPLRPHELGSGTVLKTRLNQNFSTENTTVGAAFSAELLADAGHSGEVLLPAGSVIRGHITAVHGGKRIGGPASLRLQPTSVTLPDGSTYPLHATVSGLDGYADGKVTDEGAIQPKGHPKETAAALGLTTTAAAVTGAVVGGGVGAVVGAGIGAGIGTVVWLKQDQQETLPAGTGIYLSLDEPLQLAPR